MYSNWGPPVYINISSFEPTSRYSTCAVTRNSRIICQRGVQAVSLAPGSLPRPASREWKVTGAPEHRLAGSCVYKHTRWYWVYTTNQTPKFVSFPSKFLTKLCGMKPSFWGSLGRRIELGQSAYWFTDSLPVLELGRIPPSELLQKVP